MSKLATAALWRCANSEHCIEAEYSETLPEGWGAGPGGLLCAGCRREAVAKRHKTSEPDRPSRTEPVETHRTCEHCGEVYELGGTRTRRYCSMSCRNRAAKRRTGKT